MTLKTPEAIVEPTTLPSARIWEAINWRLELPLQLPVLASTNRLFCWARSFQVNSQSPRWSFTPRLEITASGRPISRTRTDSALIERLAIAAAIASLLMLMLLP